METSSFQDFSRRESSKQVTNSELWRQEAADRSSECCQCLHEPAGLDNFTLHRGDGKRRHGWNLSCWKFLLLLWTAQVLLGEKTLAQPFPGPPPTRRCLMRPFKFQQNLRKLHASVRSFRWFLNVIPRWGIYGRCKDREDCFARSTPGEGLTVLQERPWGEFVQF